MQKRIFFLGLACALGNVLGNADALKIDGYAKAMYVHDDRKESKPDQRTPGFGGKLGVKTPDFEGFDGYAAWYQVTDFGLKEENPKQTDAYMFGVNKEPYGILGEAYLHYKHAKSALTFGRQMIDTPIISSYDYRIIPNLFEAYTLTDMSMSDTKFTLSYVTQMSGLDGLVSFENFETMSAQTYTSLTIDEQTMDISKLVGTKGVVMSGAEYENKNKFAVWNYYCQDVLNTLYLDGSTYFQLNDTLFYTLSLQYYRVDSIGVFDNYLKETGLNGNYDLWGIKHELTFKPEGISIFAAYNRFSGNDKTITAFGNWGGYPEYVAVPYMFSQDGAMNAIAQSNMQRIGVKFELGKIKLEGQTLMISQSHYDFNDHIIANSDIWLTSILYNLKTKESVHLRVFYELRNSPNYRYDNHMLTLSLRYDFSILQ